MKTLNQLIFAAAMLVTVTAAAQQDPMYTHYMYNMLSVNPAYAGSKDGLSATALHRSQWTGFKGAPLTQTLTVHSPLKKHNLGLGLSLMNDHIGPVNTISAFADFSYTMKVSESGRLALGLKGGASRMQNRLAELDLDQGGDVMFQSNITSRFLPNFGFGAYYRQPEFFVGLSIPKLLENDYDNNTSVGGTRLGGERRHYYLTAGALFRLTEDIDLKPTGFVKITRGAPIEGDITAMLILRDRLMLGCMYRTADAAGLLLGINLTSELHAGYSFDWSFGNRTLRYNYGSHEIMLTYVLPYQSASSSPGSF
jgi:type IX secretion system PorP/SprF family membrane protein